MAARSTLPTTPSGWRQLLDELGVRPSKGRGQNFLTDPATVERIVEEAGIRPGEGVLEIGPGLGSLTGKLLEVADHLTAVELDATLAAFLTRRYGGHDNFTLHRRDVLTLDVGPIFAERPTRVVANLPYSAASAIVRHVLEAEPSPPSLTIMVQREVAERMLARPPEMSILGVATQLYAEGQIAFLVPPEVFIPAPTVESAVLTLRPVVPRRLSQEEAARLFTLVGAGFRHKRKNIANSMELELCLSKSDVNDCLLAAGIDPTRRAQTLSIEEWIGLARSWPDAPADP